MHPWTFYALELANDRKRSERDRRWLHDAGAVADEHPSRVRRPMAVVFAALSRGSAAAARRLDECVADDLGRSLAVSD